MRRMFLISIAATLVIAPAAGDAASSKRGSACADGKVCVWTKKNFRGDREVIDKKGRRTSPGSSTTKSLP